MYATSAKELASIRDREPEMVESHMMQGFLTEGSADSGYGISLLGFYCPNAEYPGRLDALCARVKKAQKL